MSLAELSRESSSRTHQVDLARALSLSDVSTKLQDVDPGQHYREVYSVRLAPNQAVQIDLRSKEFDALLQVYDQRGNYVANDDDSGGNTDARLYFHNSSPKPTQIFVVAQSLGERAGKFQLDFARRPSPTKDFVRNLAALEPVAGKLDARSPLSLPDQHIYNTFEFEAAAGDRVRITADTEESAVGLELRRDGKILETIQPSELRRTAALFRTLDAGGKYEVSVLAAPDANTNYKLALNRLPPPLSAPAPVLITIGQVIEADFAENAAVIPGTNRPYALYRLEGRANEAVSLSATMVATGGLRTGRIPLTVEVGIDTPVGFAAARQIRVGDKLNTGRRGTVVFDRDGPVFIRVSGPTGAIGRYTLTVEPATAAMAASPTEE
jgi:hypothetical protein